MIFGRELVGSILGALPAEYEMLREIQGGWSIETIGHSADGSTLSFVQKQEDETTSVRGREATFKIHGVDIFNKTQRQYQSCCILIYHGLINSVTVECDALKDLDPGDVRVGNISREALSIQNPDRERLLELVGDIDGTLIQKLDLDSVFAIEESGTEYLVVIDMQDGDYVAIDQKRHVFRLKHDSNKPVRQIASSVESFLGEYSALKDDLVKYFKD